MSRTCGSRTPQQAPETLGSSENRMIAGRFRSVLTSIAVSMP